MITKPDEEVQFAVDGGIITVRLRPIIGGGNALEVSGNRVLVIEPVVSNVIRCTVRK